MKDNKEKKVIITEETLEKYEDNLKADNSYFDTEQEIEVRIPIEAYLTLTIKCNDPQVAMLAVLNAHRDIGLLSLTGGTYEFGDTLEEKVHCIVKDTKEVLS